MEGIDLTERDLLKMLERHGVRKLEPKGEKFDPNLHQAMFEIPDPSVPNGTVREVVQAGFTIGDRVLRPALGRRRQGRSQGQRGGEPPEWRRRSRRQGSLSPAHCSADLAGAVFVRRYP